MGGKNRGGPGSPHPLTLFAGACFCAMIALVGVRDLGLYAVMLIDAAPETAAQPGPASQASRPAGPGATVGLELSARGDLLAPSPSKTVPAPSTTLVLGELLGEVDRGAALPDDVEPRRRPVGLSTSAFAVEEFPVRAVGIERDGQLEVPDETEIGWYQYGSTAGEPGATVLAAHVSWNGTTGPFFLLETLEPGAQVEVTLDDGTTRTYDVTERTLFKKDQLPRERIWRNTGPETLVLITCGGDFNPEIRRFEHNVVVFAVPAD